MPANASDRDCSDFSTQRQAQLYFLRHGGPTRDPDRLDGEGDGVACESRPCPCYRGRTLPESGPTPGPNHRPDTRPRNRRQTIKSRIIDVIDGDTIKVRTLEPTRKPVYTVPLIGIDTPEMRPLECGALEATDAAFYWSFDNPRDTDGDDLFDTRGGRGRRVVLVTDPSQGLFDRHRRLLAYVTIREHETLNGFQILRGWSRVYVFSKPFARVAAFRTAERRARRTRRGAWDLCNGRFHRRAPRFDDTEEVPPEPVPAPTPTPTEPIPTEPPPPSPSCDPSYPTVCIPPPPPDLDCGQISPRNFAVVGSDPHGFDADGDGVGCET